MLYQLETLLAEKMLIRLISTALMAFIPAGYASANNGMDLLQKMSIAADSLNYSGEFVYVTDGKISSMKINHIRASANSGSQQKLISLDGSKREIILQDDEVSCVLPDEGMGLREKRQSTQPFRFNISDKVEDIEQHYALRLVGNSRVAGRDCTLLEVTPKDKYRYGYTLCIDAENALLLKSELSSSDGSLLESYMFVNIEFGNTDLSQLASDTPAKQLTWMDDSETNHDLMQSGDGVQKWRVVNNQSGFELKQYIERVSPVMQAKITHLVLGDGLANVSVFIAPAGSSANKDKKSLNMGSLNSFTLERTPYMITAIGEVPQETVAIIAKSTELK